MKDLSNSVEHSISYVPTRVALAAPVAYTQLGRGTGPILAAPQLVSLYWGGFTQEEIDGMHYVQNTTPAVAVSDADLKQQIVNLQNQGHLPAFSNTRIFLIFTKGMGFSIILEGGELEKCQIIGRLFVATDEQAPNRSEMKPLPYTI